MKERVPSQPTRRAPVAAVESVKCAVMLSESAALLLGGCWVMLLRVLDHFCHAHLTSAPVFLGRGDSKENKDRVRNERMKRMKRF